MTSIAHDAHYSDGQDHDRLGPVGAPELPTMASTQSNTLGDLIEITPAQKMLSATSGSLLTGLLVTPLDVVRVRLQSQGVIQPTPSTEFQKLGVSSTSAFRPSNLGVTACCREVFFMNNNTEACIADSSMRSSGAAIDCAVEQTKQRTFNSTLDGLRKISRNEGFTTLWRGLSPTLLMAIPANMIYFTGYEWLRFNKSSPIQRTIREEYAPLVAGASARILAATAVGPIDLFRTRLQASAGSSASGHLVDTFRDVKDMVGSHGYRSLWRGLTLTLWRDVPFSGMYWWGYETIRGKLTDAREQRRGRLDPRDLADGSTRSGGDTRDRGRARRMSQSRENHTETFTDSFIAGALSGAFASVVTMPFDVGKTRTQVYRDGKSVVTGAGEKAGAAALAPEEQSMIRLLWHIFSTEGMPGLFKGWIPRTLKIAPACAIMISSYEVGKRVFRGVNERAMLRESENARRSGPPDPK